MDLKIAIQENNVQKAEEIIKMELVNNPLDIQWWIKLSLTELQFPFEDYVSALDCIEKIKKITDNNVDALILETGIKWHNFGFIEEMCIRDRNMSLFLNFLKKLERRLLIK